MELPLLEPGFPPFIICLNHICRWVNGYFIPVVVDVQVNDARKRPQRLSRTQTVQAVDLLERFERDHHRLQSERLKPYYDGLKQKYQLCLHRIKRRTFKKLQDCSTGSNNKTNTFLSVDSIKRINKQSDQQTRGVYNISLKDLAFCIKLGLTNCSVKVSVLTSQSVSIIEEDTGLQKYSKVATLGVPFKIEGENAQSNANFCVHT